MYKHFRFPSYFMALISLACLFLACGGSSPGSGSTTGSTGSPGGATPAPASTSGTIDNGVVRFTMDGRDWVSGPPGHPDLGYEEEAITDGDLMINFEAFAEDGSYLAITAFSESGIGPGTYPITDAGMRAFYKDDFTAEDAYLSNGMEDNPGYITITNLTAESVSGTFTFAMRSSGNPEDIRQVTDGSFDLRFTTY